MISLFDGWQLKLFDPYGTSVFELIKIQLRTVISVPGNVLQYKHIFLVL